MKRAWVDDVNGNYKNFCRTVVQQLLNDGKMTICMELLSSMVTEFSTQKSSEINVTWEYHEKARSAFQSDMLPDCFQVSTSAIKLSLTNNNVDLAHSALSLLLEVLTWDFSTFDVANASTQVRRARRSRTQSTVVNPPTHWAPKLADVNLVNMLVECHNKFRGDNVTMTARQSLIQLASLSKRMFRTVEDQLSFLTSIMNAIFTMCQSSLSILSQNIQTKNDELAYKVGLELYDCSQALLRIFTNFDPTIVSKLTNITQVLDQTAQLTCDLITITTLTEELIYHDALSFLLDAWSVISISDALNTSNHCLRIFTSYVDSRVNMNRSTFDDTNDDCEDCYLLEESLTSLAVIARKNAAQSLTHLHNHFTRIGATLIVAFSHTAVPDELFDQLEWIFDFIGYVVCDDAQGESPIIPQELINCCKSSSILFTLMQKVLEYSNMEREHYQKSSPRIAEKYMWLLKRWMPTYLMPDVELYSHHHSLSSDLASAYGSNENGTGIALFILSKILFNLFQWQSEPDLAKSTCECFRTLVKNPRVVSRIVITDEWRKMILMDRDTFVTMKNQVDQIKGAFTECLSVGCDTIEDYDTARAYSDQLLEPIRVQFDILMTPSDAKTLSDDSISKILYCLEKICGVVRSSGSKNRVFIWEFLDKGYSVLIKMVMLCEKFHIYQNIVNSCLKFYVDVTAHLSSYLDDHSCAKLYKSCLECINVYRKYNVGKTFVKEKQQDDALEESSSDVLCLLNILTHMTSREFLDFGGSGDVDVPNVIFEGLNLVLPLITLDILDYPKLCKQYFDLTAHMMEVYPHKISDLSPQLFSQIVSSLMFGLKHADPDINRLCYESIASIAGERCAIALNSGFLETIIGGILFTIMYEKFDFELMEPMSRALYFLVIWSPDKFRMVAQNILNSEADAGTRQRMASYFDTLNESNMVHFNKKLKEFTFGVRVFLKTK
ncbi:nuclear protein export protein Xpo4 [Acrasis kona]|uniref:Exportin-4 n=1 Tax=Acrasis kona TaxID=1008807 RepID=A0AAW2ZAC6_9EUKA